MSGIKNYRMVDQKIGVAMQTLQNRSLESSRRVVRAIFERVLHETPQYSGRAVAHWQIGLGAPDHFRDDSLGRRGLKLHQSYMGTRTKLQKGSRYWIDAAMRRNMPILDRMTLGQRVYITNSVMGDEGVNYIETLQLDWYKKLRAVNRPYETVERSVQAVLAQVRARGLFGRFR